MAIGRRADQPVQSEALSSPRVAIARVKLFKDRKSLLIKLLDGGVHYQGLYNMMVVQLALLVGMVAMRSLLVSYKWEYEAMMFGGPREWLTFIWMELTLLVTAFAVHPLFRVWSSLRAFAGRPVDVLFALGYISCCALSVYPLWMAIAQFPPVFRVISTLEHMRLIMKSYSFIRENCVKVTNPWGKDDEHGPNLWYQGQMSPVVGSFHKYLYFLFVPTFLYRDHYPRLKSVCWYNVGAYGLQFLVLVLGYANFVPAFMPKSFQMNDLAVSYCMSLVLSAVTTLLASLCILHCWCNLHAELTTFADREFYTDWWNSTSYSAFYRRWNVPVYDWLNAYVYQDLHPVVGSRWASAVLVFFLSSIMHDYQIAVACGYFLPVLLVLFTGCGGVMYLVRPDDNNKLANLLTIAGLFVGVALIFDAHVTEIAARKYCGAAEGYLYLASLHCLIAT